MKRLPRSLDEVRGLRVARWIRESTAGQYDRYGPGAQRDLEDAAIRRFGFTDTGLAWSAAESGSTVHGGPEMRAMLDAARRGSFDLLLVGYVARWQRNLRQTLNLLEEDLHPSGVAVYFCDEELLSSNERHWDQLVDEAKAAESWLRKHRRRVREGLANKLATRNDPGGHPPYGFQRNEQKLVEPDPALLDRIHEVVGLCAGGATDRDISLRTGISLFTVRGILTSPLYVGRLRNGAKANWLPLVPLDLWEQAQGVRARRATNTGRPASPKRPYALSMLRCADCGRRLHGDTGYYRHREPCPGYLAAKPDLGPRAGRADGKGYRREWYEAVIGELLDMVSLGAQTLASVVGRVAAPPVVPDRLRLSRIEHHRDAALARYRRDRDSDALDRTMTRLDREQEEAMASDEQPGVAPERAVAWLRELGLGWRGLEKAEGNERRLLAEAIFESLEVRGFRSISLGLTSSALAHGLADVLPDQFVIPARGIVGNGRGERI